MKYSIYKNDLKFRDKRNLNGDNILWTNKEIKYIYDNQNLDTIAYRLEECKENDNSYLDLSHMHLKTMPKLDIAIKNKVKHLFINGNDIEKLDLADYKNVEVIDMSDNKITELSTLPLTLKELCCKNNRIRKITSSDELLILDCTNNELEEIGDYLKLTTLLCSNNKICKIGHMPNIKKILCSNNKIYNIIGFNNLEYLDCTNNQIKEINRNPKLKELLCGGNNITSLPKDMLELKYLEIYKIKLSRLHYYPKLTELYCDLDGVNEISKYYLDKISDKMKYSNYMIIIFKQNNDIKR